MNKYILANVIHITHKIIAYIVIFGFLLPKKYLWYHQFLFPILFLHWKTNNDSCILSQIEVYILGDKNVPIVENDHDDSDSTFMKSLFSNWGLKITSDHESNIYTVVLFTTSWLITLYRLYI